MKLLRICPIILFGLFLVACGSSPQETATDFYRSVDEGDLTKASSLLAKRVHDQMVNEQKLKDVLIKQHEGYKSMNGIKEIKVEGDPGKEIADMKAIIAFGNGQSKTENVRLIVEDGKWKIDSGS